MWKFAVIASFVSLAGAFPFHAARNFSANGNVPFGVATAGLLHLEEWFFSVGGVFDYVASPNDWKQGRVFPPVPDFEVSAWASEGELVANLVKYIGPDATISAFQQHRKNYINATDFALMKSLGLSCIRLNVGWWAFDSFPLPLSESIIADPKYGDKLFVTVSDGYMTKLVSDAAAAGLSILVDIHAHPGGSSEGSYNGVFPSHPAFWDDASLQAHGLAVVANMFKWYLALPANLRAAIHGFTVMNEPAHQIKQAESKMVQWLTTATGLFRTMIAQPAAKVGKPAPLLYVNLIQTAFADGSTDHLASVFAGMFADDERRAWAVLDVHMYLAWDGGHDGCDAGCSYACDAAKSSIAGTVENGVGSFAKAMADAGKAHGIPRLACSEFSLATYARSSRACTGTAALDAMYYTQTRIFSDTVNNITSFFWTWKMPYGGWHEPAWSLQHFLTGGSAPRA